MAPGRCGFNHELVIKPRTTKLLGVYWFHSIRPSVRPSVRPSRIMCLLCSSYSSGLIYFIFIHLIKQLQKVMSHVMFLAKFQNFNFWQFFKIGNFDFVLFWLGIWCGSLVWVIMGRRGVSQNTGVLVVVVLFCIKDRYLSCEIAYKWTQYDLTDD